MKITRALIQKSINEKEYKIDTQSILYFFIPKTNLFALTNKPRAIKSKHIKVKTNTSLTTHLSCIFYILSQTL